MRLASEQVGDGPRAVWFVHGILGRGRNWRTFARKLVDASPGARALMVDLRCHGDSVGFPAPHTLDSAAADLEALAVDEGRPSVVVGHSFGGKVALAWARAGGGAEAVWVVDSPPGAAPLPRATSAADDPVRILAVLHRHRGPAADRNALAQPLRDAGVAEPIVQWLLTSTRPDPDGWRWAWDLDGVDALLRSYLETDFWPWLGQLGAGAGAPTVHLVRATRSDRWSPDDRARLEALPVGGPVEAHAVDAGHWVHVDAPDALLTLVRRSVG